ncbi:hypothetical protein Bca52824_053310 [Brassica carinata]|uniref:K Homology domain-containing protein n=1 Tax=Brassica carinata TaxID=52824 RepID=A0A8X7UJI4_BRACI|nr:hypothetical protein Bca52824_053310 [Brassica carinata]
MNSNRNSTVSGDFISNQSNGTDGASSAEPIKCTGQSGVSSAVPIKHYHPLRCQAYSFEQVQDLEADGGGSLEEGGDRSKDVNGGSSHKEVGDTHSTTHKIEVPSLKVGTLIGKGGEIVGVIIGRGDYQEHADKVESTDSDRLCRWLLGPQ